MSCRRRERGKETGRHAEGKAGEEAQGPDRGRPIAGPGAVKRDRSFTAAQRIGRAAAELRQDGFAVGDVADAAGIADQALAGVHRAANASRRRSGGAPPGSADTTAESALERINSRIDRVHGMKSRFIRGRAKTALRCNRVVAVMMATALGHVHAGRSEMMRSLVSGPCLMAA